MQVDAADFLPALQPVAIDAAPAEQVAAGSSFVKWLDDAWSKTNTTLLDADRQVQSFAVGDGANLHEVMIALESARAQLQMMMQVRNKLLDAYQGILQMQL